MGPIEDALRRSSGGQQAENRERQEGSGGLTGLHDLEHRSYTHPPPHKARTVYGTTASNLGQRLGRMGGASG